MEIRLGLRARGNGSTYAMRYDAIVGRGRRMSMNWIRARQVAILGAEGEMYRGRRSRRI
jgi:hypothetical protein